MLETGKEQELEAFKAEFEAGLQGLFELLEVCPDDPVSPDPLSMGISERSFEELSEEEKNAARKIIFEQLGITEKNINVSLVRGYVSLTPPRGAGGGKIDISVYKTNKEGIFLHELTFADGEIRWMIGPDKNI